jgi:hypothetical protein
MHTTTQRLIVDIFICWLILIMNRYADFVWARMVVITRIFGMTIKGNATDGLVPMADMLNHRRPGTVSCYYQYPLLQAVSSHLISTIHPYIHHRIPHGHMMMLLVASL